MKDKNILRYTLRVNKHLFKKFRYVAEYNGRSSNKEIEQLMKLTVEKFEEENGKIEIEDEKN